METDLFVHFAEIAGVFVGFGALIALRSAHPTDLRDVVYLQGVLLVGIWVVVAALVPIVVSGFGVQDHALWLSCALGATGLWAIFLIAYNRTPSVRKLWRHPEALSLEKRFSIVEMPLQLAMMGSLLLIVIGVWPSLEQALYVAALAVGVVFAAYTILVAVMSQHDPQPDPDGT